MKRGSRVVVVAPPARDLSLGRFSVDTLTTLARARQAHAAAGFLRTPAPWRPEWLRTDGHPTIESLDGRLADWCRFRWRLVRTRARLAATRRRARVAWSREVYRELRRHAGNDRLPARSRNRLRDAARRVLEPSRDLTFEVAGFPRRLLRDRIDVTLTDAALAEARALAQAHGLTDTAPLVALEVPARVELAAPAVALLTGLGYRVARVGDAAGGPVEMPGVIDLAGTGRSSPLLDAWILLHARFLVCQSADWQQAAYLTNTPTLRFNARDPFAAYPVRADGLLLLAKALDLDSGRPLTLDERLGVDYFSQMRNVGHASNTAAELVDASREMHESVLSGCADGPGQAEFRAKATAAALALAPKVPYVAEWGADAGFMGDGRLARVQAEAAP